MVNSITLEGKIALSELVAICPIPSSVMEPLSGQEDKDHLSNRGHALERLGLAGDQPTRKLGVTSNINNIARILSYSLEVAQKFPSKLIGR
ncbi:hypothetical protein KEJ13_04405 [Candidatus Bathyarchaeota archaeon]|nr:hypothetical protein [Candidatus Bathyarchaeota archaeon]